MKILVVIPAHNEAENIASVIAEVRTHNPGVDILVINDGSKDATSAIAEGCGSKVVNLPFNLGYGAAVQTGMLYAVESNYDIVVLTDGDGQHDPRYIASLLEPIEQGAADLALGSRFLGKADYRLPFGRRVGMLLFSKLASVITRQQITDPTSGFQAVSRRLMNFFVSDHYPHDFPDADTLIRLCFAGFKIKEIPVTIRPRLKGESMHSGAKTLYYIYKMFFSIFIALTQRQLLAKGETNAISNQDIDRSGQPHHHADHHRAGAKKAAR